MPDATFFIEGSYYGTAPASSRWVKEDAVLQPSVVYLCPVCGETWARIIVPGQPFFAAHVACKNHRAHALEVPGSIWDPDIGDYPLPVLQRELALALAQFDREQIQTA